MTAGLGPPLMPSDAAIGQVFALYRTGGRYGHQFQLKTLSCGIAKLLFQSLCLKGTKQTLYLAH